MLNQFCLTNFLKHQRYFTPILIIFFIDEGLSFQQIFLIFALEALVMIIMEIPSGLIADKWSKKNSNILARLLIIPAILLYSFGSHFWHYLFAQCFIGLADSFKSGTFKAYIHDYLEQKNQSTDSHYTEYIGKTKYWSRIGEASAALLGSIIAVLISFKMCFYLSLIPAIMNVVNVCSFPTLKTVQKKKGKKISHIQILMTSINLIKKDRYLLYLMINSGIIVFIAKSINYIFQPFLKIQEVPIIFFGVIFTISGLAQALAARYAIKFENIFGRLKAINYLGIIYIIPLLLLVLYPNHLISSIFFILILSTKSMRTPISVHEIGSRLPKEVKATMLSLDIMIRSIFISLLLPLVGYIMDKISSLFWVFLVFLILHTIGQSIFYLRRDQQKKYLLKGKKV